MKIANIYFVNLIKYGKIHFIKVDEFVTEFRRQCYIKGIKTKIENHKSFIIVKKIKQYKFYIQRECFDCGLWKWKLYGKAETYEDAMKKINGIMYNHAGDKCFRILDRQNKKYY